MPKVNLRHTRAGEAIDATNDHYTRSPEAFRLFLGKRMKYSCGIYVSGDENLDQAQDNKLKLIAGAIDARPQARVLDIGCGWGSLSLYLAQEHGCRVTSVTPSPVQAEHVRRTAENLSVGHLVDVRVGGFLDVDFGTERFDAAAFVGSFEHMPEHEAPLGKTHRLLRPGGKLYLSSMSFRSEAVQQEYETRPASMHAITLYGYTLLVTLSEVVRNLESVGFSLSSLTDLTEHYGLTMRDWHNNVLAHIEEIEEIEPGFAAELDQYFQAGQVAWGYTVKHYALAAVKSRMGRLVLPQITGPG